MNLKEMIAPYWSEEHQGVVIPLLNKVLDAKNLSPKPLNWYENMELAKEKGREWMTKEDFHILYWQKDDINKILADHGGDLLEGWYGSSSEYNGSYSWIVNFSSGSCTTPYKYNSYVARGLVAL